MTEQNQRTDQRPSQQPYADDEISLVDLWLVLARRKGWVLLVTLTVVVAAGVYVAISPSVYEAGGSVQVGMLAGEPIEHPESLMPRLRKQHRVNHSGVPLPRIGGVEREERLITFQGRGESPDAAAAVAEEGIETLLDRHQSVYEGFRAARERRLENIDRRITVLETQLDTLSARIEDMGDNDGTVASLLTLEQRLSTQLPELERDRHEIEAALAGHLTMPTEVVENPAPPNHPTEPRTRLVMALALVLGLMLGVFAAFFREFLATVRRQRLADGEGA